LASEVDLPIEGQQTAKLPAWTGWHPGRALLHRAVEAYVGLFLTGCSMKENREGRSDTSCYYSTLQPQLLC